MANISGIDSSFLEHREDRWGYTNVHDLQVIDNFMRIGDIVYPKKIVEIGMYAGHADILMMHLYHQLESFVAYDPHEVSIENAPKIKERYPVHQHYAEPIWGNEHRHTDIDMVFVDGNHSAECVDKDLKSTFLIKPRYILVDNIESPAVRQFTKQKFKLWDVKHNPQYFFYTNDKPTLSTNTVMRSPGIMGLFKMEWD